MRVIVTGGAGFIGSQIVNRLIARGDEVTVIDNLKTGKRENVHPEAEFLRRDIRDLRTVAWHFGVRFLENHEAERKPGVPEVDVVIHCAALPRVQFCEERPFESHSVNVAGTLAVASLAISLGVRQFIYFSSSSVYGDQKEMPLREDMIPNPMGSYAAQKCYAEFLCRKLYGPEDRKRLNGVTCIRPFNVYGPGQSDDSLYASAIGIFLKNLKLGAESTIYGGEQSRDFTHVSDVAEAAVLAAAAPEAGKGEIINIGRGEDYSISQVARMIGGQYRMAPGRRNEPMRTLADITKAKKILGWEPKISLAEGIAELKKINGME